MRALRILAPIFLLGVSGCSYAFDVQAGLIDGRLAFTPTPQLRKPACVSRVMIRDESAPTANSFETWMQTAHVWVDQGGYECIDRFPLFYGEALKGEIPTGTRGPTEVPAKPLRVGTIYEVMIISGATGYGGGRFRLLPDGRVENLGRPVLTGEDARLVTPEG